MKDKQYRGTLALQAPGVTKDGTERAGITVSWPSKGYLAQSAEVVLTPGYATVILRGTAKDEVVVVAVPISEQEIQS